MAARTTTAKTTFSTKAPAKATKDAQKRPAPKSETFTDEWQTRLVESKLNEQVIREELRARNLDTKGTLFTLAKRLERHVCTSPRPEGAVIVACDDCKGRSCSTDTRCPFCGSTEDVDVPATAATTVTPAPSVPVKEEPSEPETETDEDEEDDADPEAKALVSSTPPSPADIFDPATGGFVPPSASMVLASSEAEPTTEVMPDLQGLQPSEDEVSDIARRCAHIKELALNFVVTGWDLGNELNQIRSRKLFLNLRTGLGASKYTSFAAFVEVELGFTKSWAYNLCTIAEAFTRDQVVLHGIKKHLLILSVPKDVQHLITESPEAMALPERSLKAVVAQVKSGDVSVPTAIANVTGVTDIVVAPAPVAEEEPSDEPDVDDGEPVRAPEPSPEPKRHAAPAPTPVVAPPPAPEPKTVGDSLGAVPKPVQSVTAVTMPGKFQVKLFAFQRKGALSKRRRAHNVADMPRGEYVFSPGGQTMKIAIHSGPHGWFATVEITPASGEMK